MTKVKPQTPMMTQYWDIKSAHPDKILLYRMGDFYEMFFDDALKAAPLIGIALTQRNKKSDEQIPMCGVPHHSIAGPINKLLAHGLKVAICDQIEDPKFAKGIVKRAVTRVLTPGMVYDVESLDGHQPHYLFAYDVLPKGFIASFLDASTGESFYFEVPQKTDLWHLLNILPIAEVIGTQEQLSEAAFEGKPVSEHEGCDTSIAAPPSARRLLSYVRVVNPAASWDHLKEFERRDFVSRLEISALTLSHLEVFQTYQGEFRGSLFAAIDRTLSAAGGRLLRSWMAFPLRQESTILERQREIAQWKQAPRHLVKIRDTLSGLGDLQRRFSKVGQPQTSPRDVLHLGQSLLQSVDILAAVKASELKIKLEISDSEIVVLREVATHILEALREEAPLSSKQGLIFKKGFHSQLDEYLALSQDSANLILDLENREREKTQISSLKVRYNQVFGYYIEVTHVHKDKIPASYSRKQTLVNAERYLTPELEELEKKILSSQALRNDLESQLFEALRNKIIDIGPMLLKASHCVARLDALTSLAWLAQEKDHVAPEFNETGEIFLELSRHPVVEAQTDRAFIPNTLSFKQGEAWLLTGPNMAGKSTLMRQIAVTVLLAQMGGFVPAARAHLPIFDKLFTRIGASDQLSQGLSTFMVEMKEAAEILKSATPQSLVILDEIGRGTATYDGMSLAQAIFEFLMREKKSTLLFATHYHELCQLEESWPQLQNKHMGIFESKGQIDFLYTLKDGPAERSYGIHVAELAGVPGAVTHRATQILERLEEKNKKRTGAQLSLLDFTPSIPEPQASPLEAELASLNISQLTPLQALNWLSQWQEKMLGFQAAKDINVQGH